MIRIGTIYQKEVNDSSIQNVICPNCKSIVNVNLSRSVQTGTILFIPFIKKTVQYYSSCPYCHTKYIFSKKDYNQIIHTNSSYEWNTLSNTILESKKEKSDNGIVRSKKNVLLTSILALVSSLLGIQNLYMGHTKRFFINISLFILAILLFGLALISKTSTFIIPCALLLATNVYWGIIDLIRILSGHAKDSSGAYLLTNMQYKKRLTANSKLHNKMY